MAVIIVIVLQPYGHCNVMDAYSYTYDDDDDDDDVNNNDNNNIAHFNL